MSGTSSRRLIAVGLLLLCCAPGQGEEPLTVDFCDLAQSPNAYVGELVRVRGQVSSGWPKPGKAIKAFTINQLFSSTRCGAELSVVPPDRANTSPDLDVRRDEAYERFEKALHSSMTIEATFQGQIKAARRRLRGGTLQVRLVLDQVVDVDAHVLYNK